MPEIHARWITSSALTSNDVSTRSLDVTISTIAAALLDAVWSEDSRRSRTNRSCFEIDYRLTFRARCQRPLNRRPFVHRAATRASKLVRQRHQRLCCIEPRAARHRSDASHDVGHGEGRAQPEKHGEYEIGPDQSAVRKEKQRHDRERSGPSRNNHSSFIATTSGHARATNS